MKKFVVIIMMMFVSHVSFGQQKELCESPEEADDLNSITKCAVLASKQDSEARQISVKVTTKAPKRFFKRRKPIKKKEAFTAGNISISGIDTDNINQTLVKNNVASLAKIERKALLRKAIKFSRIEQIPMFESCKNKSKEKNVECFNKQMIKHVKKYFKYPAEAAKNRIQGDVWVRFVIDENGDVSNIKAVGPKDGTILEKESLRVVENLPKFRPGIEKGKAVMTKYSFPISFSLD